MSLPPLIVAAKRGDEALVISLLSEGADINVLDHNGWTPLYWASYFAKESIVSLLIERGADLNIRTIPDGWTALVEACSCGHQRVVSLLLEGGADIHLKSKKGISVLEYVREKKKTNLIPLLEEAAARGMNQRQSPQPPPSQSPSANQPAATSQLTPSPPSLLPSIPSPSDTEIRLSLEVTRLNRELEDLRAEKIRESALLQTRINELQEEMKDVKKKYDDEVLEMKNERESMRRELQNLTTEMRCRYFHNLPHTHLRIEDEDFGQINHGSTGTKNRIVDGTFRSSGQVSFVFDQLCKFKLLQSTSEFEPNPRFSSLSRLENEKSILLKLQFHSGGSQHHVKCLDNRLEWNQQPDEDQDLYVISSEKNWIKNDENSKPRLFGLVLELGGMNLATFLRDPLHSLARFGIILRVSILKDIVSALEFLERHRIVHGDLKPENIVSFQSTGNGLTCWKLIDFENSYDLLSRPLPKIDLENTFLTPEYIPPELATPLREINLSRLNPTSPSPINHVDPTHKIDIWSLGLVSVFVLKGQTLWDLYNPSNTSALNIIVDFDENHFNRCWLSVQVGEKEKSFIEDCLRVNPSDRRSASILLRKSLFSIGQPTVWTNSREITMTIRKQLTDLTHLFDQAVTVEHLDDRFTDAVTVVLNQIQNISSINRNRT